MYWIVMFFQLFYGNPNAIPGPGMDFYPKWAHDQGYQHLIADSVPFYRDILRTEGYVCGGRPCEK